MGVMEGTEAGELISKHKEEQDKKSKLSKNVLEWFLEDDRLGNLYPRGEAEESISQDLGITIGEARTGISGTVEDIVDPVQLIVADGVDYIGIIEYRVYSEEGAYGYTDHDHIKDDRNRVVCAKCVEDNEYDENITHATQGEGTASEDATWDQLVNKITAHYSRDHTKGPSEIEPGATLLSGTTVSGNIVFTSGNASNTPAAHHDVFEPSDYNPKADVTGSVLPGNLLLNSNNVDLQGGQLTDTTQDFLDITGQGKDLRISTGQSIEDSGGNPRITFGGNTDLRRRDNGFIGVSVGGAQNGGTLRYQFGGGNVVFDANGNFDAVKYNASPSSPGELELTNASLAMQRNLITSGQGRVHISPAHHEFFDIGSDGGTEVFKLGEFRQRNSAGTIIVEGADDQGAGRDVRTLFVTFNGRGDGITGQVKIGGPGAREPVDIIITQTTNDANGDGHDDAYLYLIAEDFANPSVFMRLADEFHFTRDFQNGLSTSDIVGNIQVDSRNGGDRTMSVGSIDIRGDDVVVSSERDYDIQKNGSDANGVINFKT